jgi:hypothetical protein
MRPNTVVIKFSTTLEVEEELNQVKSLGLAWAWEVNNSGDHPFCVKRGRKRKRVLTGVAYSSCRVGLSRLSGSGHYS